MLYACWGVCFTASFSLPRANNIRTSSIILHAEFKLPNFFGELTARTEKRNTGISIGDRVAVVGASGNVGRLVALRLADLGACKVRAIARNGDRAAEFLSVSDVEIEVFSADTKDRESLSYALEDCDALVIVTGTTAFPTLAWRNGNTPDAVDNLGV